MLNFIKRILGLHVHSWSKWEVTGRYLNYSGEPNGDLQQARTCTDCGFLQIQRVKD